MPLAADADTFADALAQLALVTGGILLTVTVATLVAGWLVVRRIRRSRRLRLGVHRSRLAVRAVANDDAGRRLARLRLQLSRSIDATERSIGSARAQGAPVGQLESIGANLLRAGHQLDAELALAEKEPDASLRRAWTAWLSDQVGEHASLAADLRRSVLSVEMATGPNHLARVGDHLAIEIDAMQAWTTTYRGRPAA